MRLFRQECRGIWRLLVGACSQEVVGKDHCDARSANAKSFFLFFYPLDSCYPWFLIKRDLVKIIPVRVEIIPVRVRIIPVRARFISVRVRSKFTTLISSPLWGIRGGSLYVRHSDDIGKHSGSGNIGASAVALYNHRVAVVALGGEQHHVVGVLQIVERMALVNGS